MHDAQLGRAFLFLDRLAEYTLLSMTVMVTTCLWDVVGMKLVCAMSKFPQAPFARAPFGECRRFQIAAISNRYRLGFEIASGLGTQEEASWRSKGTSFEALEKHPRL